MSVVVPPAAASPPIISDPWVESYENGKVAGDPPERVTELAGIRSEAAKRGAATRMARRPVLYQPPQPNEPSQDAVAVEFVDQHQGDHLYISPWHRWMVWDDKRWRDDAAGKVYYRIRMLVRSWVEGGKAERSTANSMFIGGVERILRNDVRMAAMPDRLDTDPWSLNTQSGIVNLKTGVIRPHDPAAMCSRITNARVDHEEGAELWDQFLEDITQGDQDLRGYLQRVAGYCATGVTNEDILVYLFGIGANGKSSFAEAVAYALGDYSRQFAPEVLMEQHGVPGHPTELAQFRGVRFGLTSEPASNSAWNDSRVKALTGDAKINARVMRGDPFEFVRTHKTMVLGNHMPRLAEVTAAIKRRVQMVPFRAVFDGPAVPTAEGGGMRERLIRECGGAILAWVIEGARIWSTTGTKPPKAVTDLTKDYLDEQDLVGQWLAAQCDRSAKEFERVSDLHRKYSEWCEGQGYRPKSALKLTEALVAAGFRKESSSIGKTFYGIRLRV